jgi:two-component system sensor histidine kinase KdpD
VSAALGEGRIVALGSDGARITAPGDATPSLLLGAAGSYVSIAVPLRMRGRTLGVVTLADTHGLALDRAQGAFAEGLAHYATLALERARLAAEAEHVAALREADRLKDAVVASVSHDLRTPLTTIRALASEMRASQDERAMIIEEEAERLNRFVTDLLDLSRLRAGALALDPQVIAGEDLVGAALQRVAGLPAGERIVVRLPTDGTLPAGRMDFVPTLRVLVNLLENALRHTPAERRVELEVEVAGNDLVFRVLDRGPGIDEGERERIFEPFQTASARAGTGLGLAIARSLAEAQGGSLEYLPRPGGGSVFVLKLPAEAIPGLTTSPHDSVSSLDADARLTQ